MRRSALIEARKSKRMTRYIAAQELNISAVYLKKLENGTSKPGRDLMVRLEKYYGLSVRILFPDVFLSMEDIKCSKEH